MKHIRSFALAAGPLFSILENSEASHQKFSRSTASSVQNFQTIASENNIDLLRVRGGGEQSKTQKDVAETRSIVEQFALGRETLNELMNKAASRHKDAVRAARDAYWSLPDDRDETDSSGRDARLSSTRFDSYALDSPSWSVPDFADILGAEKGPCIHVTSGAASLPSEVSSAVPTPLFSPEECRRVIDDANAHFRTNNGGEWTTLQSGRFPVCGFWIKEVPAVHSWFNSALEKRLFPALIKLFPEFVDSLRDLVCDNAYLFKYTPETGERTDVHTDSGALSFTIALNSNDEYEGGGTWFDSLDQQDGIINMNVGHVTFRPGGVRHRGDAVTGGVRYIIGGFAMHKNKIEYVRLLTGLGMELANEGRYEEAEEALKGSIVLNPKFDGAYINLANVLTKAGKNKEAMTVLEEARKVNPLNGEAAYSLGMLKKNAGDIRGAQDCFDACLVADKCDAEAMMGIAVLCAQRGDLAAERFWFSKILTTPGVKKETAASAYTNLGVIIGENGDKDGEIAMYFKALDLVPDHFHALHSLALAYGASRRMDESIDTFRSAIGSAPSAEKKTKVLQDLYQVTVMKINSDPNLKNKSREELLVIFKDTMGEQNYAELMTALGKR